MTNTLAVCLISAVLFCSADLSFARQLPKECSKGPSFWCKSLRSASDCGAVGHCTATVWSNNVEAVSKNEVSDKFVRLFKQLKDVKDLIDEDYLSTRVKSACTEEQLQQVSNICKENTSQLDKYLMHVLTSGVDAETICRIVGMCNNEKIENALEVHKKRDTTEKPIHKQKLLGGERCTWGPAYWCSNFSTGHECSATHHCIERVWSKMEVKEDNSDICKICTDMVKQARDTLESNQTQEELKEVFDGSCKLIPIKLIASQCMKAFDQFIPELVETLASQMNPQVVCSVAGLCNNQKLESLMENYRTELKKHTECNNCHTAVGAIRNKFDTSSYEDVLFGMLQACRKVGSLSDSCSMLVVKYYEDILSTIKSQLRPDAVCHLSGQCAQQFHSHDLYTFPVENGIKVDDDVPCEFCEQLVKHLRDIMVANTTEVQFYRVIKGLCKQTGNFKTECLHLAEEYYPMIYNYLVSDLKPKEICQLLSVCKNSVQEPIAPLLPRELTVKVLGPQSGLIGTDEANSYKVGRINLDKKETNVNVMQPEVAPLPLPLERMFIALPKNKAACSFCQYFLHYLQVELSDTRTEEKVRDVVEKACDSLPQSVMGECREFISDYGPAVIALLVQEIDPSSVCPALGLCPQTEEVRLNSHNVEKSNCPLCLFAVEQVKATLKNNNTETSIRKALDKLCTHLSDNIRAQCTTFVDTYSNQLVEMLVADMNAQQICVILKQCTDNHSVDPLKLSTSFDKFFENPRLRGDANHMKKTATKNMLEGGDIETNEISDNTINGRPINTRAPKTVCVICEFVLKEIDDQIKNKHNEDEIKKVVHGICKHMPKSVRADCDQFVEKYSDLVISLLAQELEPSEVCEELKLCPPTTDLKKVKAEILDCAVCQTVVMAVKKVLSNDKLDRNIVHIVEKSCGLLPAKYNDRCHTLLEIYGDSIIHLVEEIGTKGVCHKIGLCLARDGTFVNMH